MPQISRGTGVTRNLNNDVCSHVLAFYACLRGKWQQTK